MIKNLNIKLFILFGIVVFYSCKTSQNQMNTIQTYVFRLKPGEDLKQSIQNYVNQYNIKAGWMVTCAGSLTQYQLRLANQMQPHSDSGHFEIVSLTGTLSSNGSNLHMSVSDSTGKTIGGHLMDNCKVYTTAEIVIQSSSSLIFKRENDGTTPWQELKVEESNR